MSACEQWREQVMDHALGQPASAELQAHLTSCAACSAALDSWRARAGQLDDGVHRAVGVEPSAQLEKRILSQIASRHLRPARPWRWKIAAAIPVVVAVLIALVHNHSVSLKHAREQEQLLTAAAALGRWRSPTESLLHSPSQAWLRDVPRLGKTFLEMKSIENLSKQEKQDP